MKVSVSRYRSRFFALIKHPFFWTLTVVGNAIVLLGGLLLYGFESAVSNGQMQFLDCLLWSMGTVTTVGYGDFTPQTVMGKWTILLLMATGTLFVWSYMAFLVTGLIAPELSSLEKDVHDMEKEIHELKSSSMDNINTKNEVQHDIK